MDEKSWLQSSADEKGKVTYIIPVSKANSYYTVYDGETSIKSKSDTNGVLKLELKSGNKMITIKQI